MLLLQVVSNTGQQWNDCLNCLILNMLCCSLTVCSHHLLHLMRSVDMMVHVYLVCLTLMYWYMDDVSFFLFTVVQLLLVHFTLYGKFLCLVL